MDEEFNDYKKNRKKINCLLKNHSEMINIIDDGIVKSCKSASEEVFREIDKIIDYISRKAESHSEGWMIFGEEYEILKKKLNNYNYWSMLNKLP